MSSATRIASFEQLALPLLPSLYSHACWLCRNPAEAEDLVQETITKALRGFESYQAGTNFKAWIFRILRNTFLTSRTGMAATHTVFLEDHPGLLSTADASPTPEDILIRLDDQAAVNQALDQLQPILREALLLCDVEELKYKEMLWSSMSRSGLSCRASRALAGRFINCCKRSSGNHYDSTNSGQRTSRTGSTQRLD